MLTRFDKIMGAVTIKGCIEYLPETGYCLKLAVCPDVAASNKGALGDCSLLILKKLHTLPT